MYTGFEPVGLLINALFLVVLAALAFDREINPRVIVLAGLVGAFAYLNKLAYAYVPLALVCAIFWKAYFGGIGWRRTAALIALSLFTFVAVVVADRVFHHRMESVRIPLEIPSKRHPRFGAVRGRPAGRRER